MTDSISAVKEAAAGLVAAYGAHDPARYFASFAPQATFIFHSSPRVLGSRAAYEQEWQAWEADGFHVLDCRSLEGHVHMLTDDIAIFAHRVRTRMRDAAGEHDLAERETIVFRREPDGRWLGVHEHLSPEP